MLHVGQLSEADQEVLLKGTERIKLNTINVTQKETNKHSDAGLVHRCSSGFSSDSESP